MDKHSLLTLVTTLCFLWIYPLMLSEANSLEWVLDPFCGRGTTNFAARLRGLPSVGVN